MKIERIKLIIAILSVSLLTSYAQVTVGSDLDPTAGTLLNLKQNDNSEENASSGILLTRVYLTVKNELYPMFEAGDPLYTSEEKTIHTGLIVYNLTTDADEDLCPGPYVWNGSQWDRLWEPCTPPLPPVEIACTNIYITGYQNQEMSATTPDAQIPYTLTSGSSYDLPAGIIGTYGGVTASVAAQTLGASGFINVSFSGTPAATMSLVPFSIDIAGSTCSIFLSVMKAPAACPDGTTARAFVFRQGSKWYALTENAQTIEFDTEEEALRDSRALQYCNDNQTTGRCIVLFNREGERIHPTGGIRIWPGESIAIVGGCSTSLVFYEGGVITDTYPNPDKNVGAVNVSGGTGQFGHLSGSTTATMTTKQLR